MLRKTAVKYRFVALGLGFVAALSSPGQAKDMPKNMSKNMDFALGKALFDRLWTSAPASTDATDGLGPLFNARSCAACHPKAGRGRYQIGDDGVIQGNGLLLRIGSADGLGDSTYGVQLQPLGIQGFKGEGLPRVRFDKRGVPHFSIKDPHYGPLDPKTRLSGRIAPSLLGLGLLERVLAAEIVRAEDPEDKDGDGISGRAAWVSYTGEARQLGRFNWKAAAPTIQAQSAGALNNDIGMSSPLKPKHAGDCTAKQPDCLNGPHGPSPRFDNMEVSGEMLGLISHYVSYLPAPRPLKDHKAGAQLFRVVGCVRCHRDDLKTADGRPVKAYTDLLLHDLGAAMADGIAEGAASGSEFRTAPLWGLGSTLKAGLPLLHDGRAKTLAAAIGWHGGEAAAARAAYHSLNPSEQQKLHGFLEGL